MAHEHEDKRAQDLKTGLASDTWSKPTPDHGSSEAQDVVRVLSVGPEREVKPQPRQGLEPNVSDLAQLQELCAQLGPMLTDRDRGHSMLTALLSSQLSGELIDSHGQPLDHATTPDPASDSFYHELTELSSQHLLIDKTDFLSSYLGGERRFDLIARPLGMGKTVLLKIIAALYSGRRDILPDNLAVLRDWHEAPKDVIYLDFAQLCHNQNEMVRHSYPTTEELIAGPYICSTDILNRRRSQGLVAHVSELDYQFYRGDAFAAKFYDQLYQQCTRLSDVKEVSDLESAPAEDFSGILSSSIERTMLLQVMRLLDACQANSRVLIIDNFDAPLLSAMHLPECYNLRASLLSRVLLLLSQHGRAFRHILLSAQCALPELSWQPYEGAEAIVSDLNTARWQSSEFATRLGFTVDELKAQVPQAVFERVYDYLSLNYAIADSDALWELFAQNFGGYSFDREHEVLLPRLVVAQLCQPDLHFNPTLSYDHSNAAYLEPVEVMPDLDILYLHAISRLPFESLIRFFNTVLRGRCYASPDLYQLPLSIPGYPDQIPGRDKLEIHPAKEGQAESANGQAESAKAQAEGKRAQAEDKATSAQGARAQAGDEQAQAQSANAEAGAKQGQAGAEQGQAGAKLGQAGAEREQAAGRSAAAATPDDLELYAVRPSARPPRELPRSKKQTSKRRKLSAPEKKEEAQDRIDAILGFGDQVTTPSAGRLTSGQIMLQDLVAHLNNAAVLKAQSKGDQSSGLDYSKVQGALQNLEIQAKSATRYDLLPDYDLVGYFEDQPQQPSNVALVNALRGSVAQANAEAESQPEALTPQADPTFAPEVPELGEPIITYVSSTESDRKVALDVLKKKRLLENNVLQAAFEHTDARAEGGFPTVNSADLAALERMSRLAQTGPTGAEISEDASDEVMSEVARLDLIRARMARARGSQHEPNKIMPFELSDLLRALGFLTYSRERTLPNLDLVPNRYVYRKLRAMVLAVLFRADCPLNSKSEGKLSQALGPSKRVRREIEYDFTAAIEQVEHLHTIFKIAGLGELFKTMQGERSIAELRMELGDLPDLTLEPEHFFPVKGQAPVYVPLLTNIINWLSVPGPITLSANAVNEAVALFCQLHLANAEELALGRDLPKMLHLVDQLELSRAESEQFRREVEAAALAAQQYHQAEDEFINKAPVQVPEQDPEQVPKAAARTEAPTAARNAPEASAPQAHSSQSEGSAQSEDSAPDSSGYKSPAAAYGLFIYDEDTERDPELEAQALSEISAQSSAQAASTMPAGRAPQTASEAQAESAAQSEGTAQAERAPQAERAAPADTKQAATAHGPIEDEFGISWDDDTAHLLQRAHDLSLYDESWRGVNFSTRPIEDDSKARNIVQKALSSEDFDLPQALLEVASVQVRRHHNLTIYTPGSAIVIEFAIAKSEEQLSQMTSMALHNLVHVDSPLQAALGKSPYELETTQVQRVLLVGLVQGRRIVVRKVLVVDVNQTTADF